MTTKYTNCALRHATLIRGIDTLIHVFFRKRDGARFLGRKELSVCENDGSDANGAVKNEEKWKNVKITGTHDRLTKITCIDMKTP